MVKQLVYNTRKFPDKKAIQEDFESRGLKNIKVIPANTFFCGTSRPTKKNRKYGEDFIQPGHLDARKIQNGSINIPLDEHEAHLSIKKQTEATLVHKMDCEHDYGWIIAVTRGNNVIRPNQLIVEPYEQDAHRSVADCLLWEDYYDTEIDPNGFTMSGKTVKIQHENKTFMSKGTYFKCESCDPKCNRTFQYSMFDRRGKIHITGNHTS